MMDTLRHMVEVTHLLVEYILQVHMHRNYMLPLSVSVLHLGHPSQKSMYTPLLFTPVNTLFHCRA